MIIARPIPEYPEQSERRDNDDISNSNTNRNIIIRSIMHYLQKVLD